MIAPPVVSCGSTSRQPPATVLHSAAVFIPPTYTAPGLVCSDVALIEVIEGLRSFFDEALGTLLLYTLERYQYADFCGRKDGRKPSDYYGYEHLIRLLVKLPELVSKSAIAPTALVVIKAKVSPSTFTAHYAHNSCHHCCHHRYCRLPNDPCTHHATTSFPDTQTAPVSFSVVAVAHALHSFCPPHLFRLRS
jgi:MRG protein